MNPPPQFPHGFQQPPPLSPPKRESQLVGPRPSPLKVSKDSHKIRKQPGHPPLPPAVHGRREEQFRQQRNEPVIIYAVSPKVIHATVADFMSIVQRLTGPSTSSSSPTGADLLSPAARLASIEKTSPSEREKPSSSDDFMDVVEGVEMGQFPSILSPAPATLPPISAEFFSPVADPQTLSMLHDLSPFWQGNSFTASPSALLSAPLVSPSPSYLDIFNNVFDF